MAKKKLDPIPPGEILTEEFLGPLGISQSQLARDLNVPYRRVDVAYALCLISHKVAFRNRYKSHQKVLLGQNSQDAVCESISKILLRFSTTYNVMFGIAM